MNVTIPSTSCGSSAKRYHLVEVREGALGTISAFQRGTNVKILFGNETVRNHFKSPYWTLTLGIHEYTERVDKMFPKKLKTKKIRFLNQKFGFVEGDEHHSKYRSKMGKIIMDLIIVHKRFFVRYKLEN